MEWQDVFTDLEQYVLSVLLAPEPTHSSVNALLVNSEPCVCQTLRRFTCARCGGAFTTMTTFAEKVDEFEQNFPGEDEEVGGSLCDGCYNEMFEEIQAYGQKHD